jgi:hypothetical protein
MRKKSVYWCQIWGITWDGRSEVLFSYMNCAARVPKDHPLRAILRIVDDALAALSPEFEGLYAKFPIHIRPDLPGARVQT